MKHITKKSFLKRPLSIAITAALVGCFASTSWASNDDVVQFGYMKAPTSSIVNGSDAVSAIREQALESTATGLGAQGALAWRAKHIDANLQQEATKLDHIFNFNSLIIKPNVLPPVLTESNQDYTQDNNDTIRLAAKTYQIVSQARFITVPPTWRDYLWLSYPQPTRPDKSLLPQNKAEIAVWNNYFKQGWEEGLTQANQIFSANLSRLKRDINGMVLYRQLLKQNLVSAPSVASANLGVTGDSNHIRIGDQVLRITAKAKLQTNSKAWQPIITQ